MPRFSLQLEKLEQRRMMDADSVDCVRPEANAVEDFSATVFDMEERSGDGEWFEVTSSDVLDNPLLSPSIEPVHLSFAVPLARVFRSDSHLITIANSDAFGQQKLWGIREGGESGGEIAYETELGQIWVEEALIDGDRLLLIGAQPWQVPSVDLIRPFGERPTGEQAVPATIKEGKKLIAVDLTSGEIIQEFELPPGFIQYADFTNGKATIILQRTDLMVPMIWPPVETNANVYRLTWDAEGIGELQNDEIPSGTIAVGGDRILVAVPVYSVDTEASFDRMVQKEIRSFKLTPDGIEAEGRLRIDGGAIQSFQVNDAADRAVLTITKTTRSEMNDPRERPELSQTTSVLLIDLLGEAPVLAEKIEILNQRELEDDLSDDSKEADADQTNGRPILDRFDAPLRLISESDDYLVFQDYSDQSLGIVDLASGLSGDERLKWVELPDGIVLGPDSIQLDDDRIVFISGNSFWNRPWLDHESDSPALPLRLSVPIEYSSDNSLATLSLSKGELNVQKLGDDIRVRGIRLIDAQDGRFGFESFSQGEFKRQFVFGQLDAEGSFVTDGQVEADSYFEIFYPHTDTITLATIGGIETFSYADPAEPLYSLSFADKDTPPLKANDDAIKLYSSLDEPSPEIQSDWIDLLVNDQIPFYSQFRARIVELIDAPEGVNLASGRYVWLDSRIESHDEPIVFKYRISDGIEESVAEVQISLAQVSEEQRNAIITAVKVKAAEDFGLPIESITVEPAARIDDVAQANEDRDVPSLPDGRNLWTGPYLSQSPLFAFRVTAQGMVAIYGSDLAANVYQIAVLEREDPSDPSESLVELTLAATDDAGKPIEAITAGESFWIELRGQDLRRGAKGIFSAFANLSLPESLAFEGTAEAGEGYSFVDADDIATKIGSQFIEGLGVIDADGTGPGIGSASRLLLRVRVTAKAEDDVTLVAAAARGNGEETAVFGETDAIKESEIKRTPLTLRVTEPELADEPTDVDGDGQVRPIDALRVINVVSRHGVGTVEELQNRMSLSDRTAASSAAMDMRRLDVNRSGTVTPLDALLVINHLSREQRIARNAAASTDTTEKAAARDEAVPVTVDPAIEEQTAKRRRR